VLSRTSLTNGEAVSTFSSIAPVAKSSGKSLTHRLLYACAKFLHQRLLRTALACVAFDPDERKMGTVGKAGSGYRKLHVIPAIVAAGSAKEADFYLTRSAFCSSTLRPDVEGLKQWSFAELFDVEKKVKLKAIRIQDAMRDLGISSIDWFKTDSQGTDLRLFESIPEKAQGKVMIADFEPGIRNAYEGDDKIWHVMGICDNEASAWLRLRNSRRRQTEVRGRAVRTDEGRDEKRVGTIVRPHGMEKQDKIRAEKDPLRDCASSHENTANEERIGFVTPAYNAALACSSPVQFPIRA